MVGMSFHISLQYKHVDVSPQLIFIFMLRESPTLYRTAVIHMRRKEGAETVDFTV